MENSASRSCFENTSNATIVCVRLIPGTRDSRARDRLGDLLRRAHAQDRHEVPLPGHRAGLGDALDVGERAAEVGHRLALGLDQDDRVGHRRVRLARRQHDDLALGRVLDVRLERLRRRSRSAGTCRSGSGSRVGADRARTRSRRRSGPSCSGRRSAPARRRRGCRAARSAGGRRTGTCRRGGRRALAAQGDQQAGGRARRCPFGVVEVCQAGTSLTQPQSNVTVPPRFGS